MPRGRRERALPPRDAEAGEGEPGAPRGERYNARAVGAEGVQAPFGAGVEGEVRGGRGSRSAWQRPPNHEGCFPSHHPMGTVRPRQHGENHHQQHHTDS